jgi:GNAT superfamily N-acetyltransferase
MDRFHIRQAHAADADVIAGHRVAMFRDMGLIPSETLEEMLRSEAVPSLDELLRNGRYVGWLAIDPHGRVIAGAGVHVKDQLPRISPNGTHVEVAPVPLVVNVYTEPEWRRRGIARTLMATLMSWAVDRGFDRVVLHASDHGRPLYASLGFVATNEMCWPVARRGEHGSPDAS